MAEQKTTKGNRRPSRQQTRSEILDLDELATLVGRRVRRDKLSLQGAWAASGVSPPTLSRIMRGVATPGISTVTKLSKWLGVPVERIVVGTERRGVHAIPHGPGETTEDAVEAHLRVDPNLSDETAKALAEIFRALYKQVVTGGQIRGGTDSTRRTPRGHEKGVRRVD